MKALLRRSLLGIVPLLLLTCAFDASAFYDSTIGRWASRDPIGDNGGNNLYSFVSNEPVGNFDPLGLDAAVVNYGGYTGHTSFVIIRSDGTVVAYHFYARSHLQSKCCGLGSLRSVCCDKVSIWSETSTNLTNFLQSQKFLRGEVTISAYCFGTDLDDSLAIEDLNEQANADAGIYSLLLGKDCHGASQHWFDMYRALGPELHPTLAPGGPWPEHWPERWFETPGHHRKSLPQFPSPPGP